MDTEGKLPASTTAYIVWVIRILLPIVLFWIWFRTQPGKESGGKHSYPRNFLLLVRQALEGLDEVPPALENLRLADEAQAQRALGGPPPRGAGGGGSTVARRDSRSKRVAEKVQSRPSPAEGKRPAASEVVSTPARASREPLLNDEEQMHLESLLNFVAFSHKDRPQRVFLPDTGQPPPPPRRPPPSGPQEVDAEEVARGNFEAQMVLKGLVNPKIGLRGPDVAQELYRQLTESRVSSSEATYSLMVESCVNAGNLRGASELLMKMESAGFCAAPDLLDKVMDLYSQSRAGGGPTAAASAPAEAFALSGDAAFASGPGGPGTGAGSVSGGGAAPASSCGGAASAAPWHRQGSGSKGGDSHIPHVDEGDFWPEDEAYGDD